MEMTYWFYGFLFLVAYYATNQFEKEDKISYWVYFTKAQVFSVEEFQERFGFDIFQVVSELALKASIDVPPLFIPLFENKNDKKVFASQNIKNEYYIVASLSFLESLNQAEITAVLAHEIAHIKRKACGSYLCELRSSFAFCFFYSTLPLTDPKIMSLSALVVMIFFLFMTTCIFLLGRYWERKEEFWADKIALSILLHPRDFISLLQKWEKEQPVSVWYKKCSWIMSTHPLMKARIRALEKTIQTL